MKRLLAAILALLVCLAAARATSPIILAVDSNGGEPKYAVNNQSMTEAQLAGFLVGVIEDFGDADPLILDPDGATTMATLEKVLHLLHSSGVKTVYRRAALDDPLAMIDLTASLPAQGSYLLRKAREADFLSPTGSVRAPGAASPGTGSTFPR
ncbi:MAG: hypothetical protein ACO1QR_06570 [Chthoniobacteraceae bacterium]